MIKHAPAATFPTFLQTWRHVCGESTWLRVTVVHRVALQLHQLLRLSFLLSVAAHGKRVLAHLRIRDINSKCTLPKVCSATPQCAENHTLMGVSDHVCRLLKSHQRQQNHENFSFPSCLSNKTFSKALGFKWTHLCFPTCFKKHRTWTRTKYLLFQRFQTLCPRAYRYLKAEDKHDRHHWNSSAFIPFYA